MEVVIVGPTLISSIYSRVMPEGHLGRFLQTLHSSRWEANMIWILIHPCSRRKVHAVSTLPVCVRVCERYSISKIKCPQIMFCFDCCFWEPNTSWLLMRFRNYWIGKMCSSESLASYNHLQNNESKTLSKQMSKSGQTEPVFLFLFVWSYINEWSLHPGYVAQKISKLTFLKIGDNLHLICQQSILMKTTLTYSYEKSGSRAWFNSSSLCNKKVDV